MKVKLIQYNFGYDSKYMQLCKLTEQINKKYCDLHGYDHEFDYLDTKILEDLYGKLDWSLACVYKLQWVYEKLIKQDADYLIQLDADAVVSNPNIKIEDLIDDKHQLFLSKGNERVYLANSLISLYKKLVNVLNDKTNIENKDYTELVKQYDLFSNCEILSDGWIFHNEGLYIIKNTPLIREFFKDCVDVIKYFIHRVFERGRAYDGMIMDFVLQQEKYNNIWTFMYPQAQGGAANSYETAYNVEKTFVLHNYGQALNLDQKIDWIKSLKQNKWWKGYYDEN